MSSNANVNITNALVFSNAARQEYSRILDKIANGSYINNQGHIKDLDRLLNAPDSYDKKYLGNLKSALETSKNFSENDIYLVIQELVIQIKQININLLQDVDFLENMGFWDFITALWLYLSKLLPTASIRNWGSYEVYKDIEKKRHPFKGPGILYIMQANKIGLMDKSGKEIMTEDCLKYYINGTVTKRGEVQEQLLFRLWIAPQDNLLMAIHKYMTEKKYPISKIRDVIADLSEINAIVDFSGMKSHADIVKLINA